MSRLSLSLSRAPLTLGQKEAVGCVWLIGDPGMGKSSLAIDVGHRLWDQSLCPGGSMWGVTGCRLS